jgi:hypothetical protein
MTPDPLDRWAESLFENAVRERPSAEVRQRALERSLAVRGSDSRVAFALGAAALLAAAGVAFVVLPLGRDAEEASILPEQARSAAQRVPSVPSSNQVLPPTAERPAVPPAPTALPSAPTALPSAPTKSKPLVAAPVPSTLEQELALLERARAKLSAGDSAAALSELDRYAGQRGGRLVAEATLLRLQALTRAGRAAEASRIARKFVADNPDDPLAERARSFIQAPAQ